MRQSQKKSSFDSSKRSFFNKILIIDVLFSGIILAKRLSISGNKK